MPKVCALQLGQEDARQGKIGAVEIGALHLRCEKRCRCQLRLDERCAFEPRIGKGCAAQIGIVNDSTLHHRACEARPAQLGMVEGSAVQQRLGEIGTAQIGRVLVVAGVCLGASLERFAQRQLQPGRTAKSRLLQPCAEK